MSNDRYPQPDRGPESMEHVYLDGGLRADAAALLAERQAALERQLRLPNSGIEYSWDLEGDKQRLTDALENTKTMVGRIENSEPVSLVEALAVAKLEAERRRHLVTAEQASYVKQFETSYKAWGNRGFEGARSVALKDENDLASARATLLASLKEDYDHATELQTNLEKAIQGQG